jgi:hypothetical protein
MRSSIPNSDSEQRAMLDSNKSLLCIALLCVLLLKTLPVFAGSADGDAESTHAEARALAVDGRAAYGSGEYERALVLFRKAYGLLPAPTISIYEARALARLARLVEARDVYKRTAESAVDADAPQQFERAVEEAKAELTAIELRIPKVALVVMGEPGPASHQSVFLDGIMVPSSELGIERSLDPGQHHVVVRRPGLPDASRDFVLSEAQTERVELWVDASPGGKPPEARHEAPPPSDTGVPPRRIVAYGALGLGAAGLGTGIIVGLVAGGRHSDAERGCPGQQCVSGSAGAEALDDFRALRTVSTVGYVVGAVGLGTGITLLFTEASGTKRGSAYNPWLGLSSAGVEGSF